MAKLSKVTADEDIWLDPGEQPLPAEDNPRLWQNKEDCALLLLQHGAALTPDVLASASTAEGRTVVSKLFAAQHAVSVKREELDALHMAAIQRSASAASSSDGVSGDVDAVEEAEALLKALWSIVPTVFYFCIPVKNSHCTISPKANRNESLSDVMRNHKLPIYDPASVCYAQQHSWSSAVCSCS